MELSKLKDLVLGIKSSFNFLMWPLFFWVKTRISKDFPSFKPYFENKNKKYIYVIHKSSFVDRMILLRTCRKLNLPLPIYSLKEAKKENISYLPITKPGLFRTHKYKKPIPELKSLIVNKKKEDLIFIPVSIIWGRNPGKTEDSFLKLLFYDDFNAGFLQKMLVTFVQGRNNLIHFGEPFQYDLAELNTLPIDQQVKKIQRIFRIHFWRRRNSLLGRKLYNRWTIVRKISFSKNIVDFINLNATTASQKRKLRTKARRYIEEITSDISFSVVRFFAVILNKIWNKLFDGVEIKNLDSIKPHINNGHEIIFLPNHRSHLDYLLLNYCLYKNDLQVPHTAAGINLNFWPLGPLLRRAGAFFIRRQFSGNKLYTAICQEYLSYIIKNGHPLSFFPEGGRSRHGRLLKPKVGMLTMVIKAFLNTRYQKILIVPVNISYDRIIEIRSYLKELSGQSKISESFKQLFNARKYLRNNYGKARIHFGEAIDLDDWVQKSQTEISHSFKHEVVHKLANEVMKSIQKIAPLTPSALVSACLHSHPSKAISEEDLISLVNHIFEFFSKTRKEITTIKPISSREISEVEKLDCFSRFKHPGGDVLFLSPLQNDYLGYYKNNIIHFFAVPSLITLVVKSYENPTTKDISNIFSLFIPFINEDFFTDFEITDKDKLIEDNIDNLVQFGALRLSKDKSFLLPPKRSELGYQFFSAWSQFLEPYFEKYTLLSLIISKYHSNQKIFKSDLVTQCHKMAQKIAILEGIGSPEALHLSLYKDCIAIFIKFGFLIPDNKNYYKVNEKALEFAQISKKILGPDLKWEVERLFRK